MGASSSRRIGCVIKISRAFVQRYLISYSWSCTGLPGRFPRTVNEGWVSVFKWRTVIAIGEKCRRKQFTDTRGKIDIFATVRELENCSRWTNVAVVSTHIHQECYPSFSRPPAAKTVEAVWHRFREAEAWWLLNAQRSRQRGPRPGLESDLPSSKRSITESRSISGDVSAIIPGIQLVFRSAGVWSGSGSSAVGG